MPKTIFVLLLVAFGVTIKADMPFPDECPEVKIVEEFDIDAYMGIWYEYSKYPFIPEIGKKCMYARYKNIGNDTVDVENASINRLTNLPSSTKGKAYVKGPGRLAVVFNSRQNKDTANYFVLGTDYESYAVVYSCASIARIAHNKSLWILTRERKPPKEAVEAAKSIMDKNNLSQSFLIDTVQTGCPNVKDQNETNSDKEQPDDGVTLEATTIKVMQEA